jgi:hypothetical protein
MQTRRRSFVILLGVTAMTGALVSCASEPSSPGPMDEAGTALCAPGAMKPAPDGCNSCICTTNGAWACTEVGCDKSDASKDSSGGPASCTYAGTVHHVGDSFGSVDGCTACRCTQTGEVSCIALACETAEASSDGAVDGGSEAGDGSAEACCPSEWSMYGCLYLDGGSGLACHNPAMGCASSNVCGQGCDKVVSRRCGATGDLGCAGPRPTSPCGFCTCNGNIWVCSGTQCPPPDTEAGSRDAAITSCGAATCGAGEWCDTTGASPTCRCGQTGNGCGSGMQCCVNPLSGCGPAHCNEACKPTCQN